MNRSFRAQLALRAAAVMAMTVGAISVLFVLVLGAVLDKEIDASLLGVAAIQAGSLTDERSGGMHFHEWDLTPDEADSLRDLVRYAQVWRADGVSLLRSQYMTADLPLDTAQLLIAGDGDVVWARNQFGDLPIRVLYYPLERLGPAHSRHVLQVAAPLKSRNQLVHRVAAFVALLSVLVTGATVAGSWWLAGRAIRPVHEVIDQAEEIGASSLDRRIHAYADTREYRRLVEVLNTMLARIQGAFESQRRFTADAGHELRSPLTAMRGELEIALRRDREAEEYRRVLNSSLEEVVRLGRITEDLLILARSDSGALRGRQEPVELDSIVSSVVERLRRQAEAKSVTVEVVTEGDLTAESDPVLVGQVVWNLVENAIKFASEGGRVRVLVKGDEAHLTLSVEDDGPGFPGDQIDLVFSRFFRADRARPLTGGTGLGLAIVKAVVEALGGEVGAENLASGGARVRLRFSRSTLVPEEEGTAS